VFDARKRLPALILVLAVALASMAPTPVAAAQHPDDQPPPPPALPDDLAQQLTADQNAEAAYLYLLSEVALLIDLDAFGDDVPSELVEINERLNLDGLPEDALFGETLYADELARQHSRVAVEQGFVFDSSELAVFGPISIDELDRVERGGLLSIPAQSYLDALQISWARGFATPDEITISTADDFVITIVGQGLLGSAPPPADLTQATAEQTPTAVTESPAAQTESPAAQTESPAAQPSAEPESPAAEPAEAARTLKPWVIPSFVSSAIIGVMIALMARRRRSSGSADSSKQIPQMLEIGRRMTASRDDRQIAAIAVEQSISLTGASAGAFVITTSGDHHVLYASSNDLLNLQALEQGLLGQAMQTGQPIKSVASSDPAIRWLPAAVLLTPIIADGRVEAVLMLGREPSQPFEADEAGVIAQLAPIIGSALQSARDHTDAAHLANVDGLTQLGNRRRLDSDLNTLVASGQQSSRPVSFAMFDVDHFKTFNDTNGHAAGDVALRQIAELARTHVRPNDVVYRYGGEEFCIILPDTTQHEALAVAERVRMAIETEPFDGEQTQPNGNVTISVGIAETTSEDPLELVKAADAALYEAKELGRNRTEVAAK
jgi:diguanylate cyclase (GGDEF)-like protein